MSGDLLGEIFYKNLVNLDLSNIKNVLVLGQANGHMLKIFNKLNIKPKITAVELDPEMIKLSKKVDNLELIEGDAYDFIFNTDNKQDMVIIDVFFRDVVPSKFFHEEFLIKLNDVYDKILLQNLGKDFDKLGTYINKGVFKTYSKTPLQKIYLIKT